MKTQYDQSPYGKDLAEKVADKLLTGEQLMYRHRDYCGTGLQFYENNFEYGEVHDCVIWEPVHRFAAKEDFVKWLAQQSDHSMAWVEGSRFSPGNQTINRDRLEKFVK